MARYLVLLQMKRALCFLLVLASLWAAFFAFRYLRADKFSFGHIQSPLEKGISLSYPFDFSETYKYLGKGSQFFVFESLDQTHVIKFIRFERLRIPFWEEKLTLPPFLAQLEHEKRKSKIEKQNRLFASCELAYKELPHETGILYLHLKESENIKKTITIEDRIGRKFSVDLDKTAFVVQKKADLIFPRLEKWISEGKEDEAKQALSSLIHLHLSTFRKGIIDLDPVIKKNAGFLEKTSIFIDIGQFAKDEKIQDPSTHKEKLCKIFKRLQEWLDEKDPKLFAYFDEEIASAATL